MKKKNLAFTLAETLIVIAIIGVVAALTLPNLNSSTADKETVTKVKKIYAGLTDAYDRAVAVYGPMDGWFNGAADNPAKGKIAKDRIIEFMKFSKDCGTGTGCWSTGSLLNASGSELAANVTSYLSGYNFVNLADGMSLAIGYSGSGPHIYVDIDGPNKGKTQLGKDIFVFGAVGTNSAYVSKDTLTPEAQLRVVNSVSGKNIGSFTTSWIIQNSNADYLKGEFSGENSVACPDGGGTLNWETKTSCN